MTIRVQGTMIHGDVGRPLSWNPVLVLQVMSVVEGAGHTSVVERSDGVAGHVSGGRRREALALTIVLTAQQTCLVTLQYETLADKRIVVAVDGWDTDSMYPTGHYTRTLGKIGERETETEVCFCLRCQALPF